MASDVGTLDIPTSAYRPDSEVGVEVSDAIVTGHPDLMTVCVVSDSG